MKQTDTKPDDQNAFEQLAQRNGTAWIFDQLQNLGGPQLVLLHLANSLSDYPSTADDSRLLFELIEKLDELYGWPGCLDCQLGDLHAFGYPLEPKPRVIEALKLNFGERTEAVLESLRRRGHKIEGGTVSVPYPPGSDGYIGTEAAPRLTPKQERSQVMHRLAAKIGLPAKEFSRGMKNVRKDMSFQTDGEHTRFSSKIILDWDEVGIRSGLAGFRGTEAHVEVSSRYQGVLIRKSSNLVDRQIAVELDEITYSASVPLDELSIGRVFAGLNIFSFFAKD